MKVNIHEAKTHLSRLVDRAAAGEDVVIARSGKPLARLIAYQPMTVAAPARTPEGKIWIAPDFDEGDDEIIREFEESELLPGEPDASAAE